MADEPQSQLPADLQKIQLDLEHLQKLNQEYLDGWKRAKADYINFKRDAEKEKTEIVQFANAGLLLELFPIVDNFQTALKHVPEDKKKENWVQGFSHIERQFLDLLKNMGVEPIKTLGEKFNPEFHDAAGKEKKDGVEPGVVLEEVRAGYTIQGKVIRHAKVKVSE